MTPSLEELKSEQSRTIMEGASTLAPESHEWLWIARDVWKIPMIFIPALQEAIRQGRWNNDKSPVGYLKMVTAKEAARMGLEEEPNEKLGLTVPPKAEGEMSHDDYIDQQSSGAM